MEKKMLEWRIETDKKVYKLMEEVKLKGDFKSTVDNPERWYISTLLSTDDPRFGRGITRQLLILGPLEERENVVFQEFVVSENYPSGKYKYSVTIEHKQQVIDTKEVEFSIEGTPVYFEVTSTLSSDEEGKKRTRAFLLEDKEVFLKIKSEVSPLELSGVCVYPSGNESGLVFAENTARIEIHEMGKFLLKLEIRSEGYRTIVKHVSFSVVSHHPEFRSFKSKQG